LLAIASNCYLPVLPVSRIDVGLVVRAVEKPWKDIPDTASRLQQRIENVLDFAITHGYRAAPNPARWKANLDHLLPKASKLSTVEHFTALDYRQVGVFMVKLRVIETTSARAPEFLIVTATRAGRSFSRNGPRSTSPTAVGRSLPAGPRPVESITCFQL
jgi:hypothetical protein